MNLLFLRSVTSRSIIKPKGCSKVSAVELVMPFITAATSQHGLVWYRNNLDRRSNHARPYIEARQRLPANTVHPGGQSRTFEAPKLAQARLRTLLEAASKRVHSNVLVVALAAKLARMAWSMLAKCQNYAADLLAHTA